MSFRIKDKVWVQQAFLLPENALDDTDRRRRVLTSAAFKFTDTTLGGNFSINAPPQFTRFADIRVGGSEMYVSGSRDNPGRFGSTTPGGIRWMNSTGKLNTQTETRYTRYTTPSAGMGRYYSEAIDDWGQDLVLRFGVPEYNSLTTFFGNFYDSNLANFARTGRTNSLFTLAGRALGFLVALPLQPVILGGQFIRFLGAWPVSKYYYLKPAMFPYWTAVNTIANAIAVNLGVIPYALTPGQASMTDMDARTNEADQREMLAEYAKVVPDIFLTSNKTVGGIDVYRVANRAQRIANTFNTELYSALDKVGSPDSLDDASKLSSVINDIRRKLGTGVISDRNSKANIDDYRTLYLDNTRYSDTGDLSYIKLDGTQAQAPTDDANADLNGAPAAPPAEAQQSIVEGVDGSGGRPWYNMGLDKAKAWFGELAPMFEGERRDGAQYVSFRVNYSGTSSEDFSSSTEESQIAQKFNSMSSSARSARFDWANGNLTGLDQVPLLGPMIEGVTKAAKDVITGALDGLQMSGLLALAGNAFVDIPKTWSGSSANLTKASYTIQLRSPYGTRMSMMMNLFIPLAMLMAAALPLSTGKRSYTSPFICEAYCRGRHAIRLGIFESLSISRGEGNLGWTQDGHALGIDVNFTIADLSSVMHLPIQANFGFTDAFVMGLGDLAGNALAGNAGGNIGTAVSSYLVKGTYDDDNTFTDYMAVLGGLSWQDLVYANRRWRLSRYRQMTNWSSWKSPARFSMLIGSTAPGRFINAISTETDRGD